jgi:hypothetical protein
MLKRIALLLSLCLPLSAQVNLNTTIPAPQVKGILQPANGGLGISLTGLTGCIQVADGAVSVSPSFCPTAPSFTINSFTGCSGALELGQTVTNPTCNSTYSLTPTSASITNTDAVDSPLVLTSPFTSGTIVGSFAHSSITTTTITLTAINGSTQTATQAYTWNPRIFGGVGTTGATSTVTASGTTAILSNSSVLSSLQLAPEIVGESFGPYSPSAQAIYLLLTGSSHTFIDAGTGFPMAFNSPTTVTFVNANGVSLTLYLYQTTNPLTGTFQPKIAS